MDDIILKSENMGFNAKTNKKHRDKKKLIKSINSMEIKSKNV